MSQSAFSPSTQLKMIQINGYRFPDPSFNNLLWLSMVPEQSFVSELLLFDFPSLETNQNDCPFFSTGGKLPHAEYSITKCTSGAVNVFWIMDDFRRDRIHPIDRLKKELSYYPSVKENETLISYKIKYSKWYVFVELEEKMGEERISIWVSKDPH